MKARDTAAWLALGVGWSCALPALRVDADLDEQDGAQGGDSGAGTGGTSSGSGGKGGASASGGNGGAGGTTGGKGGAPTGGSGGGDPMCTDVACKSGEVCVGGDCLTCDDADLSDCSGTCRDLTSDVSNCGTCGSTCTLGRSCLLGECECPTGYEFCTDGCKNLDGDRTNCGQCGTACDQAQACTNGTCVNSACTVLAGSAEFPLLDDLEDNDNQIEFVDGRVGYWWTYSAGNAGCTILPAPDATGMTPLPLEPGGPPGSSYAVWTRGGGCDYAGLGFELHYTTRACPFNATAFTGVTFAYQSTTPLRFQIAMTDTLEIENGGECTAASNCGNFHGYSMPASPNWTVAMVPFANLAQYSGGTLPFDPSDIMSIQFTPDTQQAFDYWIDDVRFTTN